MRMMVATWWMICSLKSCRKEAAPAHLFRTQPPLCPVPPAHFQFPIAHSSIQSTQTPEGSLFITEPHVGF